MPSYVGRFDQKAETFLLGGMNTVASLLNIKDGEARDITNWDIDISGAISPRYGYTTLAALGTPMQFFSSYYRQDGTQVFVTVVNGLFAEATNPAGPWTDRTGGLTISTTTLTDNHLFIGASLNNDYFLANGTDKPIYSTLGTPAVTLEAASLVLAPGSLTITPEGTAGATTYKYKIAVVTGRGESLPSATFQTTTGNAALTTTNYNLIQWTPVTGDNGGYNIYKWDTVSSTWKLLGSVVSGSDLYTDTGQAFVSPVQNPSTSNASYNTPDDWNLNGYPEGFAVVARGKNQRLVAWRKNNVWFSALNNPFDWFAANDAFSFQIGGGTDTYIRAIGNLMDYTVMFSNTNGYFYTGSSPTDFALQKIQGTGCNSPYSLVTVGDDLYLWSNRGPTNVKRILFGADIQSNLLTDKIRNIVFSNTNQAQWRWIVGFHDPINQKIVWANPAFGQNQNTQCFVYKYLLNAWTKYDTWAIAGAAVAADFSIYAAFTDGNVNQLGVTNLDGASIITATYSSAVYDLDSAMQKRMLWNDYFIDSTTGAYSITVACNWDFGRSNMTTTQVLTNTTTDGRTIPTVGSLANQHRAYNSGIGLAYQFTLTHAANEPRPKVIGFRPELRARGVRHG